MRLLVDTAAWVALNNRADENHRAAAAFVSRFKTDPVLFYTTDYIVDETVTLLRFKVSPAQALLFLDFLRITANVKRVQVSDEVIAGAEKIFRTYQDKRWSFTDCVSFAFMDETDLDDAFSFDKNFTQYGKILHPNT